MRSAVLSIYRLRAMFAWERRLCCRYTYVSEASQHTLLTACFSPTPADGLSVVEDPATRARSARALGRSRSGALLRLLPVANCAFRGIQRFGFLPDHPRGWRENGSPRLSRAICAPEGPHTERCTAQRGGERIYNIHRRAVSMCADSLAGLGCCGSDLVRRARPGVASVLSAPGRCSQDQYHRHAQRSISLQAPAAQI